MTVTTRTRRRCAAFAKFATVATLGVLLLAPRLDLAGQALASSPSPAESRVVSQN